MTQKQPPNGEDGDLYTKLEKAGEDRLSKAVGDREELDPDQAERRKRGHEDKVSKAWANVKRFALWAGFVAGCVVLIGLSVFAIWLMWLYGKHVLESDSVATVVSGVITFGAGVLTTLGIEHLYHRNGSAK